MPAHVVAQMTALAAEVRRAVDLPLGINVLRNDGQSALAIATAMKGLHAALPSSRYVELAGAGHISNLDDPAGFNNALREFLGA